MIYPKNLIVYFNMISDKIKYNFLKFKIMTFILGFLFFLFIFIFIPLLSGIKILYQYENGVVFTLGKFTRIANPGLTYIIPYIQKMERVDMRIKTVDIPRQEAITKDNIPVLANTVVYYKVTKPDIAIIKIESYDYAVRQYTQAALKDVIGTSELDFVLAEREEIAANIRKIVDDETNSWGIDIKSIKIQEIELPAEMKRVMAKQAEAEREKRASIIAAQGELEASKNMRAAADELMKNPATLHLRTLQTIRDIAADPSEKIVLFLPSDFTDIVKKITKNVVK